MTEARRSGGLLRLVSVNVGTKDARGVVLVRSQNPSLMFT